MEIAPNVQNAYEQQYQGQQSDWREIGAKQKALNIMELCDGLRPQKVLEVGAGDGSILAWLSRNSFAPELYAVEISGSALSLIREKNIPQLRQTLPFDGYSLPFADDSFDLVILSHVLEHVEFERTLLREIKRVAKHCVLEVPKDYRFGVDRKTEHFLSYGHINIYTPSSLRFLLRSEGFQIMKQKIGLYSIETYRVMYGKGLKTSFLYAFKKLMAGLPLPAVRDHFANTITVLLAKDAQNLRIF
jgi:ubiquinone/menaquinone biosynthesis C-methylase UbiE